MGSSTNQAAHFPPVATVSKDPYIRDLYNEIYGGSERALGFTEGYVGRSGSFRDVVIAGEARSGVLLPTAGNTIEGFPDAIVHQGPHPDQNIAFSKALNEIAKDYFSDIIRDTHHFCVMSVIAVDHRRRSLLHNGSSGQARGRQSGGVGCDQAPPPSPHPRFSPPRKPKFPPLLIAGMRPRCRMRARESHVRRTPHQPE